MEMGSKKQNRFRWQIRLVILLVAVVFLSGCTSQTTQTQRVYHVGIVSGAEPFASIADGFKTKMTELGYIEGKNIVYDIQKLNSDPEGEKRIAKKFVDDKVDLIFAFPTEPAVAAKAATQGTGIPVVFALSGIEGTGLVESVAHPGGNITGVRFPGPELNVKRLELLQELAPQAKRVYLIYDRNYPYTQTSLTQLRPAAVSMGITLVEDPVNDLDELKAALQKRANASDIGIDAILIMPEILTQSPEGFAAILNFANEKKVPIAGSMEHTADLGGVFSYIPNNIEMGGQAATLADKIFKGTPAGTIMVVTPDSYLRINYKVAKGLELNVSDSLLNTAKMIIR
jgi:putative ABC transport system substrate-binding protein